MADTRWLELVATACKDAGIKHETTEIITTWDQTFPDNDIFRSNTVFRINDQRILKVFGTDAHHHFNIERAVLETLHDQIPAPRLIASGTLENDTPYIIMSEIPGKTLQDIWEGLSSTELRAVAREIGWITARLHQQPQDRLASIEAVFGGRTESIEDMAAKRMTEIEAMDKLSTQHKDELLEFLHGQARDYLEVAPVLNHADLSHAHVYVVREDRQPPSVSGLIDWAEAMLGPPEWDITFHWFWTFSQDHDTMHECLKAYYQAMPRPDQFARRCFATHLFTYSMNEVWDYFTIAVDDSQSIVQAMITTLFPPEVFGTD